MDAGITKDFNILEEGLRQTAALAQNFHGLSRLRGLSR